MASVTRFLTDELRLVVNQEKSQVVASEEFEFLGFAFRKSRATINVARSPSNDSSVASASSPAVAGAFRWSVACRNCGVTSAAGWATSVWRRS